MTKEFVLQCVCGEAIDREPDELEVQCGECGRNYTTRPIFIDASGAEARWITKSEYERSRE